MKKCFIFVVFAVSSTFVAEGLCGIRQILSSPQDNIKLNEYTYSELVEESNNVVADIRSEIEDGKITEENVYSLLAAYVVLAEQANQYCRFVQDKMGNRVWCGEWPKINDVELKQRFEVLCTTLEEKGKIFPVITDDHRGLLEGFCQQYDVRQKGSQIFSNPEKVFELIRSCRQDQVNRQYGDINVKFSQYGDVPRFRQENWIERLLSIKFPEFGLFEYSRRKKYYTEVVPRTETNMVQYIAKLQDKRGYLVDVIKSEEGPYRKPYNDLVSVVRLVRECRDRRWDGLIWSDERKLALNLYADKLVAYGQNVLKEMECTYINYPLLFEVSEAISICAYLEFCDRHDDRDWKRLRIISYADKTALQRNEFLYKAESVADYCSNLIYHSTLDTARWHAEKYNYVFPWVYAVNRMDFSRFNDEELTAIYKRKFTPEYHENEESYVKAGEFIMDNRDFRLKIRDEIAPMVKNNPGFKSFLEERLNRASVARWQKDVERMVEEDILYPDWCDDLKKFLASNETKSIAGTYDKWNRGDADKIKLCLEVLVRNKAPESLFSKDTLNYVRKMVKPHPLKSFYDVIKDSEDVSGMERDLLYEIDSRKPTKETKHIHNEKARVVRNWIVAIKTCKNMAEARQVAEKEITPDWEKLQKSEMKISW